jgi:YcaO-like protein with predicted kinase domain
MSTIATLDLGGTLRARTPEETLAFIRPLLPALGITRIARVTGLDHVGIPVSIAVRPASRNLSVSQGKGISPLLADVSAAMESIEFAHAETPPPPTLRGRFSEIGARHDVVDPSTFVPGWFPSAGGEDPMLDWAEVEELSGGTTALIPHVLVDFDQTAHGRDSMRLFTSTNGLASGNTLAEATCHSLYEIVERHASAQWEGRTAEDRDELEVDIGTIDGPGGALLDLILAAGLQARVWVAPCRIGLPTFVCYIRGNDELRGLGTFVGMGTHHSRAIAVCRAITEAAQSRLTIISGSRDDNFPSEYQRQQVTADQQLGRASPRAIRYADCPDCPTAPTFEANLADLIERLRDAGMHRIFRLDHTRPDLGIPVVHCFVPGMLVPKH